MSRFQFLFYAPGGHSYWKDTKADMIALSDDSGPTPDKTEDGTLWLDNTRPIVASGTGFYIPLLVPKSSAAYRRDQRTQTTTCASPQEAKMLVDWFNMKVSVDGLLLSKEPTNEQKTGSYCEQCNDQCNC